MARPKTKGPLVPVRLLLPHHQQLLARAASKGLSPGAYIAWVLGRSFDKEQQVTEG